MSEKKPPALEDLEARLREAEAKRGLGKKDAPKGRTSAMTGLGLALRLGLDFVSGVVVGVGVGLLLDWWWGTSPLMMVIFFLLGAAAGTLNVIRTASGQGGAVGYKREREAAEKEEKDKDGQGG
jgi:ATP synthase protein I